MKAEVVVPVSGLGMSVGATVLPMSAEENMTFKDDRQVPDASAFSGHAGIMSLGVDFAPIGIAYREFHLGAARYVHGTGHGATGNIEIGGSIATGSSTVVNSETVPCTCETRH